MSAVGSSVDNALAESLNATCKRQTLQGRRSWADEREVRLNLFRRPHRYNTRRRHSSLGQAPPAASPTPKHRPTTPRSGEERLYRAGAARG
ncbi:integrase core domain-containing protein [Streptomyces sporangiiformans]|nr:integrase core domain-containing protein [Streptomyces sporangiiformans]